MLYKILSNSKATEQFTTQLSNQPPSSPFSPYRVVDKMAEKCVHKGCGKVFSDPEEDCVYHPGAPIFHEGQKGISPIVASPRLAVLTRSRLAML
jgi:hypothetical protein